MNETEWLNQRVQDIDSKLDKVLDGINTLSVQLGKLEVKTQGHDQRISDLEVIAKKVESHVDKVNGIGIFFGWIGVIATIATGIMAIVNFFN